MKNRNRIKKCSALTAEEFANRAYAAALNPLYNPVKAVMDRYDSVEAVPPMLGIFNDVPWHQFRESEAHARAKAGFRWIINDAEHSQREGWYGRDQNAAGRGIHTGRVVGSGSMEDPQAIEDVMVESIEQGARLISVHPMTSDLVYRGAAATAEPFHRACARCGFA